MAYKLMITQAAHQDLDDALHYIAQRLSNPIAAGDLLSQVEACYAQLREFPFSYALCHDARLRQSGYRKAVIGNYILVYHPAEETATVYVLRFFYGGRDYEKLI